jgi:hypothetical protein
MVFASGQRVFVFQSRLTTKRVQPDLPATAAFVSPLHCHFQGHEGSHVEIHNMLVLQKETRKIQSKPGLYYFFQ